MTKTYRAHKIQLIPTNQDIKYFVCACGTDRFSYNWALDQWKTQYKSYKLDNTKPKPNEASLRKQLNAIKEAQYPWMLDVSKNVIQQAIKNLGAAYSNFFSGRSEYPVFKIKGKRDSFRTDPGTDKLHPNAIQVDGYKVKIPKLGWVKLTEEVRFKGNIKSATISRTADKWFISFMVETEIDTPIHENQVIGGADLGIKTLLTVSDGKVFDGPKAYRKNLKKLARLSRLHSRKKKGSSNRKKAAMKLARFHAKIANIRKDALHKISHYLTHKFTVLGMETLNVKGMLKNHKLALSISDMGWGELMRQIEYKGKLYGSELIKVDRWYPSSKTCSDCGWIKQDLKLSDRVWTCMGCGVIHDRDMNAAINLRNMAASSVVTACGVDVPGTWSDTCVKTLTMKQEDVSGISSIDKIL